MYLRKIRVVVKNLICLILFSCNCYAYTKEDNDSVIGIIKDGRSKHYTDMEIMETILSNTYTVPETVLCTYLPRLEGCL